MKVLVINCGSSSIKLDIVDSSDGSRLVKMRAVRLGSAECALKINEKMIPFPNMNMKEMLNMALDQIQEPFELIGHRVVHGGEKFTEPTRITDNVTSELENLVSLAPLHLPHNLSGIRLCRNRYPDHFQVAVFDTAFHSTLPRRARTYALPKELNKQYPLRRFGFHGLSHRWASQRAAQCLETPIEQLKIITCHLGNGASVCAVEYGRSIETSMGLTPLEGLVMGTRAGDIDAGLLLYLMEQEEWNVDDANHHLNRNSGLAGLSGIGRDMRDILQAAENGNDDCRLAINVFVHRLRKYIGAYAAVMNGVDAIVFTGGIGENSSVIRARVCQSLGYLGVRLDEYRNANKEQVILSPQGSRTTVLVVPADEERIIAEDTVGLSFDLDIVDTKKGIPIAISARHLHLTQEAVEILFGKGAELTKKVDISQPNQFACNEKVDLVGPKRTIKGVRVIGPTRPACQVEISRTDEFTLGIDAPIRNSGDVRNTPGIRLVGPAGELVLKEGLICARRHIHMHPDDATHFGVQDRDIVEVSIDSEGRNLTFGDVLVRVSPKYVLEMHIDTDEANAAEIRPKMEGILGASSHLVSLKRRKPVLKLDSIV
jgi:acetate kinase